jgi:hypothetical protein
MEFTYFCMSSETIYHFIRIFNYERCWEAPVFIGIIIYKLGDEGS